MFKFWENYVDRKVEKKLAEIARIEEEAELERKAEEEAIRKEKERKRLEFEAELEDKRLEKKESNEPYIEIISERFVEGQGIEIKMDWNLAMVNYLKSNGFTGHDEEDIIYAYMRAIARKHQEVEVAENYLNADGGDNEEN